MLIIRRTNDEMITTSPYVPIDNSQVRLIRHPNARIFSKNTMLTDLFIGVNDLFNIGVSDNIHRVLTNLVKVAN